MQELINAVVQYGLKALWLVFIMICGIYIGKGLRNRKAAKEAAIKTKENVDIEV